MIIPDWPAPDSVVAVVTTREGGASVGPYRSFNLAMHVGDNPDHVAENRRRLRTRLQLPGDPLWLNQVHGTRVIRAEDSGALPEADGAYAATAGIVCAVQTADCLPVLFCNPDGSRVAAVHAGWAGLLAGILESAVAQFDGAGGVMAWLGPAISRRHYEVGPEVRQAFIDRSAPAGRERTRRAFTPSHRPDHWMADLYELARIRMEPLGVQVFGGGLCTLEDRERFYSYRRDNVTGRMASLIYIKPRSNSASPRTAQHDSA